MHTITRVIRPVATRDAPMLPSKVQKRNLYIRESFALDILREKGVNAASILREGEKTITCSFY